MEKEVTLKIKKLDDRAVIPEYAHSGDVGMDFTAIDIEYDAEKDLYIYHTGLAFESDFNFGQFLFPRSSNRKTDAYLTNSVGIADCAIYRGEIMFCFKNRDSLETIATNIAINNAMGSLTLNLDIFDIKDFVRIFNENKEKNKNNPLNYAPYKVGDRIGQMVVLPYPTVNFEIVEELSDSERKDNGFGSTGN